MFLNYHLNKRKFFFGPLIDSSMKYAKNLNSNTSHKTRFLYSIKDFENKKPPSSVNCCLYVKTFGKETNSQADSVNMIRVDWQMSDRPGLERVKCWIFSSCRIRKELGCRSRCSFDNSSPYGTRLQTAFGAYRQRMTQITPLPLRYSSRLSTGYVRWFTLFQFDFKSAHYMRIKYWCASTKILYYKMKTDSRLIAEIWSTPITIIIGIINFLNASLQWREASGV